LNEKTMKLDLEKVKVELRKINQELMRTTKSLIRSKPIEDEFNVVDESTTDGNRQTYNEAID